MGTFLENIFNLKDFNEHDIELDLDRLNDEVDLIFNSVVARKNRTKPEIYDTVKIGHVLENYLISVGFENDPRKYMDVKAPNGECVDAKVICGITEAKVVKTVLRMQERNKKGYTDKIDYVIIYGKTGDKYAYHTTVEM